MDGSRAQLVLETIAGRAADRAGVHAHSPEGGPRVWLVHTDIHIHTENKFTRAHGYSTARCQIWQLSPPGRRRNCRRGGPRTLMHARPRGRRAAARAMPIPAGR